MADANLSADRAREILDYDSETGLLTWRHGRKNRCAGATAGTLTVHGYYILAHQGKKMMAHRVAWLHFYGSWPVGDIDHINGVKADNRISNLRDVTKAVNQQNRIRPQKNNTSGFLGVNGKPGFWRAQITVNGRPVRSKSFGTPEQAHQEYLEIKRRLHEGNTL